MNILVLNCGSSTVKFQIIQTNAELRKSGTERCLASGNLEKIGLENSLITMRAQGKDPYKDQRPLADHRDAIDVILKWIESGKAQIESVASLKDIHAVGHRVVHGGERFVESVKVTPEVLADIDKCSALAPLHNPANLKGIQACQDLLGENVPQVVVFDTAFHSTLAPEAFIYGLPYELYTENKVRRYGFHGTSHRFIANKYAEINNIPLEKVNIICLHLGNGCSACAIKNGKSIDTSMGFTPLEGLLMGTRSGDIDASIIPFLCNTKNLSVKEVDTMLNKKSGLFGVSCLSSDMRDLEQAEIDGNSQAKLALDMFCHDVKKYIGSYLAEMNGCDAIVFTGGVGQNSDVIRQRVCSNMESLGITIDLEKNKSLPRSEGGTISTEDSKIKVCAIPTNEELLIARDTADILG